MKILATFILLILIVICIHQGVDKTSTIYIYMYESSYIQAKYIYVSWTYDYNC